MSQPSGAPPQPGGDASDDCLECKVVGVTAMLGIGKLSKAPLTCPLTIVVHFHRLTPACASSVNQVLPAERTRLLGTHVTHTPEEEHMIGMCTQESLALVASFACISYAHLMPLDLPANASIGSGHRVARVCPCYPLCGLPPPALAACHGCATPADMYPSPTVRHPLKQPRMWNTSDGRSRGHKQCRGGSLQLPRWDL
jgi:hypothetical protein